jgi:hypothetical protein
MVQMVEYLSSKCKFLSSNLRPAKKGKRKKINRKRKEERKEGRKEERERKKEEKFAQDGNVRVRIKSGCFIVDIMH